MKNFDSKYKLIRIAFTSLWKYENWSSYSHKLIVALFVIVFVLDVFFVVFLFVWVSQHIAMYYLDCIVTNKVDA